MSKKSAAEKPCPRKCICGKNPVLVCVRGGKKMYSCPDPMKCEGNMRTLWHKSEIQATAEWNTLVAGFAARQRRSNKANRR